MSVLLEGVARRMHTSESFGPIEYRNVYPAAQSRLDDRLAGRLPSGLAGTTRPFACPPGWPSGRRSASYLVSNLAVIYAYMYTCSYIHISIYTYMAVSRLWDRLEKFGGGPIRALGPAQQLPRGEPTRALGLAQQGP